ncbi:unnamed protein product [Vitrella brassicaformis CCMP3155]|uniref:RAP domain-containing protein n=1 Tax=Vitrella brassicaformis (strain CCMP3155) TaxID=1169540 RepID=A0A0G4FDM2_VITBC|nr:unnamed protein product [Vitrella brassicaformis CCMP3155]|eukprot:CEM11058.1 unnamed protein product [Vitrella brassicaformis CCMP3155]
MSKSVIHQRKSDHGIARKVRTQLAELEQLLSQADTEHDGRPLLTPPDMVLLWLAIRIFYEWRIVRTLPKGLVDHCVKIIERDFGSYGFPEMLRILPGLAEAGNYLGGQDKERQANRELVRPLFRKCAVRFLPHEVERLSLTDLGQLARSFSAIRYHRDDLCEAIGTLWAVLDKQVVRLGQTVVEGNGTRLAADRSPTEWGHLKHLVIAAFRRQRRPNSHIHGFHLDPQEPAPVSPEVIRMLDKLAAAHAETMYESDMTITAESLLNLGAWNVSNGCEGSFFRRLPDGIMAKRETLTNLQLARCCYVLGKAAAAEAGEKGSGVVDSFAMTLVDPDGVGGVIVSRLKGEGARRVELRHLKLLMQGISSALSLHDRDVAKIHREASVVLSAVLAAFRETFRQLKAGGPPTTQPFAKRGQAESDMQLILFILGCFGSIGYFPREYHALVGEVVEWGHDFIVGLPTRDLSSWLNQCATLRLKPVRLMHGSVRVIQQRLDEGDMQLTDLVYILYALAILNYSKSPPPPAYHGAIQPADFLSACVRHIADRWSELDTPSLYPMMTLLMWTLLVLDLYPEALFARFYGIDWPAEIEKARQIGEPLGQQTVAQLYWCFVAYVAGRGREATMETSLTADVLQQWGRELRQDTKPLKSSFQWEVAKTLDRLALPHTYEYRTKEGVLIDIALTSPSQGSVEDHKVELPVALEVDGPLHFLTVLDDSDAAAAADHESHPDVLRLEQDGSTLFKHRLLQQLGWQVVSVSFADWEGLKTPHEREMWLRSKIPEHVKQSAAVFAD